jgi:hypothetical protein
MDKGMRMTPELLRQAGEALYGPQWHKPLANDLGIADRTIRRWIAGSFPIPAAIGQELADHCRKRGAALASLEEALRAITPTE